MFRETEQERERDPELHIYIYIAVAEKAGEKPRDPACRQQQRSRQKSRENGVQRNCGRPKSRNYAERDPENL